MRQGKKKCMKQQTTSIVPLAENKEKKKKTKKCWVYQQAGRASFDLKKYKRTSQALNLSGSFHKVRMLGDLGAAAHCK